ncbi:hypothetical protein [Microbacterium trichothecenolyticum]|jgi:hypothetical protein|uniref:Uncharacterized protein n=1 Tax=Microbacterium trichothecenolyticum TaxID=69370 RepID=A0A0M2HDX6_MICTR|nr:hypothetical protein [Microbacterium trichothecenolyticum]KJL42914.1 hypothetical protein RS82_01879 [Microbacterium trichothecenolyticum]
MTTPVRTDLDAYRIAVAELPESAVASLGMEGAVTVVSGGGAWWAVASDAITAGAAAVVVAQPAVAPSEALDALASLAGATPVIVQRPLLRADVVAAVGASIQKLPAPGALAVECHAPARTLGPALRDAIGWARVIAGAPLAPGVTESWGGRVLALLESARGSAVSIVAAAQPGAPSLGRARITSIAQARVEVDADLDTVACVTDAAGRSILPALFESPERVALRRAIAAVRAAEPLSDLADLRHDTALAAALLSAPPA